MNGGPKPFTVWRQDDNGQRFRVAGFASQAEAERCIAGLTRSLHKQFYWIETDRQGASPER